MGRPRIAGEDHREYGEREVLEWGLIYKTNLMSFNEFDEREFPFAVSDIDAIRYRSMGIVLDISGMVKYLQKVIETFDEGRAVEDSDYWKAVVQFSERSKVLRRKLDTIKADIATYQGGKDAELSKVRYGLPNTGKLFESYGEMYAVYVELTYLRDKTEATCEFLDNHFGNVLDESRHDEWVGFRHDEIDKIRRNLTRARRQDALEDKRAEDEERFDTGE